MGESDRAWTDRAQYSMPPTAQLLLASAAPQVIAALNNGTAMWRSVQIDLHYPIDLAAQDKFIQDIWRKTSDDGIADIVVDKFSAAGTWTEYKPTR